MPSTDRGQFRRSNPSSSQLISGGRQPAISALQEDLPCRAAGGPRADWRAQDPHAKRLQMRSIFHSGLPLSPRSRYTRLPLPSPSLPFPHPLPLLCCRLAGRSFVVDLLLGEAIFPALPTFFYDLPCDPLRRESPSVRR